MYFGFLAETKIIKHKKSYMGIGFTGRVEGRDLDRCFADGCYGDWFCGGPHPDKHRRRWDRIFMEKSRRRRKNRVLEVRFEHGGVEGECAKRCNN